MEKSPPFRAAKKSYQHARTKKQKQHVCLGCNKIYIGTFFAVMGIILATNVILIHHQVLGTTNHSAIEKLAFLNLSIAINSTALLSGGASDYLASRLSLQQQQLGSGIHGGLRRESTMEGIFDLTSISSSLTSSSSRNEDRNYPETCEIPPNEGDPDSNTVRHHLLRRIQRLLDTKPDAQKQAENSSARNKILCVLPFFPIEEEKAALDTYVMECDGALVLRENNTRINVNDSSTIQSSFNSSVPTIFLHINLDSDDTTNSWTKELNNFLSKDFIMQQTYGWVHWASPYRYTMVGFIRSAIHQIKTRDKPTKQKPASFFETWFGEGLINTKYFPNLGSTFKGDCSTAWLWNWDANSEVLPNCEKRKHIYNIDKNSSSSSNMTTNEEVVDCLSSGKMHCIKLKTGSKWDKLMRFFQIHAPAGSKQLYRIHAILNGVCDDYWNRDMGALDEQGRPGYVHDPTYIKNNPPKFNYSAGASGSNGVCGLPLGSGDEGPEGVKGLQKIRVDVPSTITTKKVLCMVYTHEGRHALVAAIAETWGPKCDGFFAASNKTDRSIGAVNLLHEGPEAYQNMWMKVVSMLKYAHNHYINDYDFFHIGGDDMYVIAENLRYTVSTGNWKGPWNTSEPLYLGTSSSISHIQRFCGGGSGYTLNAVALRLFVEELMTTPGCRPHWMAPQEDMLLAKCFYFSSGFQCMDTNDEKLETRYHSMTVDEHARWDHSQPMLGWKVLQDSPVHNITNKERLGQISERSVSFHLKTKSPIQEDLGMRRYHAIIYNLCPNNTGLLTGI